MIASRRGTDKSRHQRRHPDHCTRRAERRAFVRIHNTSFAWVLGLVVGGMVSALWGAGALSRLSDHRLSRLLAALLVAIGLLLVFEAFFPNQQEALVSPSFCRAS